MGEAKEKRRAHAVILTAHPLCIYCGMKANTIEHMPPRAMFDKRQRPKGLEFPTCRDCNNGTNLSDMAASLLARAYPDARTPDDLKRLLGGARNNIPGLIEEMVDAGAGLLRVDGPILKKHINVFGAKLGLALHYEAHGSPVPRAGGVQPMFFTNVSALRDELPAAIIELLPTPRTLKQANGKSATNSNTPGRSPRRRGIAFSMQRSDNPSLSRR